MLREIGPRRIGTAEPLFVIAEIGLNHGGSLAAALAMVAAAASSGASAVKLQSLRANRLVAASCPPPAHVEAASLRDFFRAFELDAHAHADVCDEAHRRGLAFLSTPFDEDAVDMLERVGCDAYKIASGDITHGGLITRVARTGKPVIISTGMSDMRDVARALELVDTEGGGPVALLHCVSAYPVPCDSQNLRAIANLAATFDVPVGLSDHSTDPSAVLLAVALGATIYEKHFMLASQNDAIDAAVSATPDMLADLVRSAEAARLALGHGRKECLPAEARNRDVSRRGLYAARDLHAGDIVTPDALVSLRPWAGLDPRLGPELTGWPVDRDVRAGTPFLPSDLEAARTRSTRHAA
jgi:N,N'-diacetyllegionaminate synthase